MRELLKKFENKQPEIVFEWKDAETEAEGWVVINSLRGGAAGGGTRMRKGLHKEEVVSLAKTMEVKFSFCGPPIGGAKSGINFDPRDPRKKEVLERWYKAVLPLLKSYYGTGGDLNIDEVKDVIPITEDLGLLHPQEGVLMGHFNPGEEEKVDKIAQLRKGVKKVVELEEYSPDVSQKITVADLITGYGVSESVVHFYNIYGGELKGKRVIIQGWGNVAAAAAYYLAREGAAIVGIIDKEGGLINERGFSLEQVKKLFLDKNGNKLEAPDMLSFDEVNQRIWDIKADVFIPAAASRLVHKEHLDRLRMAGVEVISSGANVPFHEKRIFFGEVTEAADGQFAIIPDFIANSGMARVFAYLMQSRVKVQDKFIFEDVSNSIKAAIKQVHDENPSRRNLVETAFEIALRKIGQ
ncbi:MAG: Glu/Leu/Phe/Val dehydrogenase dimerization domain-containing protein [Bacteroidia bacterium]